MLELQVGAADLDAIAQAIEKCGGVSYKALGGLARPLVDRIKQRSNHPKAGRLLAFVCVLSFPDLEQPPLPTFDEAANLIAERYVDSADIVHFCEMLGRGTGSPTWGIKYEKHLRAILNKNQNRKIRCAASFALASVVQAADESRQSEAEQLYQTFIETYDGNEEYSYTVIEKQFNECAKRELEEIRTRGLGKPAPEIIGMDLDGKPMKLSEHRGKVVLLNFWATWCFPCMKLIPHERALAQRLRNKPFEIVGVNCDTDNAAAKDAVSKNSITWRSFKNKVVRKAAISEDWKVVGYPMLYLIDQQGIVRKRWIGSPTHDELNAAIDSLLDPTGVGSNTEQPTKRSIPREVSGKFMDRSHQGPEGKTSKYVVFVPREYDGKKAFPVLVFLHGAGLVGSDGRKQISGALAEAIRHYDGEFPFITVFPQSQLGSWQADSADGRLAMAILDDVERDFETDKKRVYLTGVSMGGEGTWSLTAAYPNRWAAIVPICGGGDPKIASKIKTIPCWCFQGDADSGVVQASRKMIDAIKDAGGNPMYHEYPRVGHNCWDITYAKRDLYEWLLQNTLR